MPETEAPAEKSGGQKRNSTMTAQPKMDRRLLHPEANRAIAMDANGHWLSYSQAPVAGPDTWKKSKSDTVCFRIPPFRAPDWSGNWQDSLVVFEEEKSA